MKELSAAQDRWAALVLSIPFRNHRDMFGLLNINKPAGCTSRDVVTRICRLVGKKIKVGHAGTLDPLATGVLVVCVGPATRLVPLIHDHLKCYRARFLLGSQSDTDDTDGVVESVPCPDGITAELLQHALPEFVGKIQQVPPAYSAVKVAGQRAYKAARRGEEVELAPREVLVSRLELTAFDFPSFSLEMECGTGTYVRSVGRDLARRLGTQAVMAELVRTSIGPFSLTDSVDIDALTRENLPTFLKSPLAMLSHLRSWETTLDEERRLSCGQTLVWPEQLKPAVSPGEQICITSAEGQLVAIAAELHQRLAPQIVLRTTE